MCSETDNKCKRIVSEGIEHNRRVWICEDGTKLRDITSEQYFGPTWNVYGDHACPGMYKGGGWF